MDISPNKIVKKEGCSKCHMSEPVKKLTDIGPGDHISMKGDCFSKTKTQDCMKYFYTHHAIVNKVKTTTDDKKGTIFEVFHVLPNDEENPSVVRKEDIALDARRNRVKKISYRENSGFEKEVVIKRAQHQFDHHNPSEGSTNGASSTTEPPAPPNNVISDIGQTSFDSEKEPFLPNVLSEKTNHSTDRSIETEIKMQPVDKDYRLFFNNCEHFCHYCCINEQRSGQVSSISNCFRQCVEGFGYSLPKLLLFHLRFVFGVFVLAADDFIGDVYISGGILAFSLLIYFVLVLLLNCQVAFFFCCPREKFCCSSLPCCCCLKMPCCPCSCCQLKDGQNWYCQYCHTRNKCLRWMRFLVILVCQVIGYGVLVWMIGNDFDTGFTDGIGLLISFVTMLLYIAVPRVLARCCARCCWRCCAPCCCLI